MFRFESLEVYHLAKKFSLKIRGIINSKKFDPITKDQLRRASLSVALNLAEGSGRLTENDIRRSYVISRSSFLNGWLFLIYSMKKTSLLKMNTITYLKRLN